MWLFCFCHLKVPHKILLRFNRCGAPPLWGICL
nr:MAG TPA: hypothetical protein [Caudoviricetes sp.]